MPIREGRHYAPVPENVGLVDDNMDQIDKHPYKALFLPLKRADSDIRWMLVLLAVADIVGVAVVARVGYGGFYVLIGCWLAGTAMFIGIAFRFGRYSLAGLVWFALSQLGFLGLAGILTLLGLWTGWLNVDPVARYLIVQSIALVPLVTGILVMSRKLAAPQL